MHLETKATWRPSPPTFALAGCTLCHGTGWQLVSVADALLAKRCSCRDLSWLVRLKERIGIPQRYAHCSLDAYAPENLSQTRAAGEARKFLERYPGSGHGLLFCGPPGTGKTHLAVAILRDLAGRHTEDLLFVDFSEMLLSWGANHSSSGGRTVGERRLQHASLLVIDNFGCGCDSAEYGRAVQKLLAVRLECGRCTVFTGEPVRCRELFQGRNPAGASKTQTYLSVFPPALLMKFLSTTKIIAINGGDYRCSHPPLFA